MSAEHRLEDTPPQIQTPSFRSSRLFHSRKSLAGHRYHSRFFGERGYRSKLARSMSQSWTPERTYRNGCVSATSSFSDISRLWVFLRLPKLGIHFSRKKLDALLRGDQSGTVLNRWFVCGPHGLGMPFLPGFSDIPGIVRFYARKTQIGWECLAELFKESDYKTKAQASVLVAAGHVLIRMPLTALLYIRKSCDFIKAGNLQFVPTYGRPPEFSEDIHETLAILSQTVYWANFVFLMCSGPEPHATAELEKNFRQELPVGSPTPALSHSQLISTIASLPDPLQDLSSDDANARYLACQGRDSAPHRPPCRR